MEQKGLQLVAGGLFSLTDGLHLQEKGLKRVKRGLSGSKSPLNSGWRSLFAREIEKI